MLELDIFFNIVTRRDHSRVALEKGVLVETRNVHKYKSPIKVWSDTILLLVQSYFKKLISISPNALIRWYRIFVCYKNLHQTICVIPIKN